MKTNANDLLDVNLAVTAPFVTPSSSNFSPPLVTRERFADLVGLPIGVVIGFVNKGYIPTVAIGKYSLVNIELLRKHCLDREFA